MRNALPLDKVPVSDIRDLDVLKIEPLREGNAIHDSEFNLK